MRRIVSGFIIAALILSAAVTLAACGGEKRSSRAIIEELVTVYGRYGEEADETVSALLKELKSVDPAAGAKWKKILALWKSANDQLTVFYDVLPDGLPDTDELCIVALGFQLNPDGTMREELIERLKVVLRSAEKYPNAYIVCTGGRTASGNSDATEAGKMAEWLIENGIDGARIIAEDQSLTTAQNAVFSCRILTERYPQVSQLAIVSSDYHIATGTLLFGAEAILKAEKAGKERFRIVSNAAYRAPSGALSTMFQAGALAELSDFEIYGSGE